MPVLRINATHEKLQMHESTMAVPDVLVAESHKAGPIVIMIHGYKYIPNDPVHCPHRKIFSASEQGWPKQLGFLTGQPNEGLCIAFGWFARGPLRQAHRRATKLGENLASLINNLRTIAPDRPIHVIAHSLGSEIALSALEHLNAHKVERMLLLTGASFHSKARDMLNTPAGLSTELFNVTSRENDLFDLAFEHMVTAPELHDRAIGQGLSAPNAVNLQLDCDKTLDAFALLGLPVARAQRRVCHWSAYQRPGIMALYTEILRNCDTFTQSRLAGLLPSAAAPRWSRFLPRKDAGIGNATPAIVRPFAPLALKMKNRIMSVTSAQGNKNEHAY
ncbi:MAG: alpha/beta hydrolase [Paracoccaceae bacterium]|nr:alpha/beta hydrolase [Paracoccaceae bacterium]